MNKNNHLIFIWILTALCGLVLLFVMFQMNKSAHDPVVSVFPTGNTPVSTTTPGMPPTPAPTPTPTPPAQFLPYGEVTLRVGETVRFPDLSIELLRVFDESRCPTGVTCIWAGTLKADVAILSGMGKSTATIELGKSLTTEAETITFTSALPYPKQGEKISSEDYRLTFTVRQRNNTPPSPPPSPPAKTGACYTGGCSNEICSDSPDMVSTCIYRSEFACYKNAKCERQTNGTCGWTETAALRSCLNNSQGM